MSLSTRVKLVRLAREFDALIICDDVYDCLAWHIPPNSSTSGLLGDDDGHDKVKALSRAAVPRIVDVDRVIDRGAQRPGADGFGNVMSNGSFSKICGPGVRTGWVEGQSDFFQVTISKMSQFVLIIRNQELRLWPMPSHKPAPRDQAAPPLGSRVSSWGKYSRQAISRATLQRCSFPATNADGGS
jgi:hypothetical protein